MPLQNRVTPTGEIVALPGRGTLMGNRGVLHDEHQRIVRTSQVKRWIACVLEFRGNRRKMMTPRTWTELFFLDEATAFAAGHRPCAFCRNADYKRFRSLWEARFGRVANVDAVDAVLHAQRRDREGQKPVWRADLGTLPDGTYIKVDGKPFLVWGDALAQWGDGGYVACRARTPGLNLEVLTPPSIVELFRAGYAPDVHPTLRALND
ncbi:MAG: hypothetical protein JO165_12500 [Candidatus Eremiobacteraeota bacterium]|nr:hypothetical protein [Candidatus Eremiobacteraeota bacterium]